MRQEKIEELEKILSSDYPNITGVVVNKNGKTAYENHFHGFTGSDAVHVFSVTKSVVSALIGIALDQGYIKHVKQKVLDFFPGFAVGSGEETIQMITLEHLLTMTAPYKYQPEPFEAFFMSENWVDFALGVLGGPALTGEFLYSPIVGTHILSGILARATGRPVLDFAAEHLFAPLGIELSRNIVFYSAADQFAFYAQDKHTRGWVADPQGLNTASWGLTLTPADMAKIGQLYLNRGMWNGRQILSADWVEESTKPHSRWREQNLSYGYLWWIIDENRRSYAAMGDGGNAIYVNTRQQLVVSVAALMKPDAKDTIELIKRYIEPAFENEA